MIEPWLAVPLSHCWFEIFPGMSWNGLWVTRYPPCRPEFQVIGWFSRPVMASLYSWKLLLVSYISASTDQSATGFKTKTTSTSSGNLDRLLQSPRSEQLWVHSSLIEYKKCGLESLTVIVNVDSFQLPCRSILKKPEKIPSLNLIPATYTLVVYTRSQKIAFRNSPIKGK